MTAFGAKLPLRSAWPRKQNSLLHLGGYPMPRIDENTFNTGKELEKLIADAIEGHVTPGALPQGCSWQC